MAAKKKPNKFLVFICTVIGAMVLAFALVLGLAYVTASVLGTSLLMGFAINCAIGLAISTARRYAPAR